MKTPRLWKLLAMAAALCATVLTTSATTFAGPVNRALTGGVIDPYATTLRVVPPKGGMVMVHQNGSAVAWFMQAGVINLKPNQIYGLTATRGTSMLFNASVVVRPGYTQAVWAKDNAPQLSYQPSLVGGYGRPVHRPATTRRPSAATPPEPSQPARLPASRHRALMGELKGLSTDRQRWNVMKSYNKRYALTVSQKRAIAGTFASASYKSAAEHTMSLSKASTKTKTSQRATSSTSRRTTTDLKKKSSSAKRSGRLVLQRIGS